MQFLQRAVRRYQRDSCDISMYSCSRCADIGPLSIDTASMIDIATGNMINNASLMIEYSSNMICEVGDMIICRSAHTRPARGDHYQSCDALISGRVIICLRSCDHDLPVHAADAAYDLAVAYL